MVTKLKLQLLKEKRDILETLKTAYRFYIGFQDGTLKERVKKTIEEIKQTYDSYR